MPPAVDGREPVAGQFDSDRYRDHRDLHSFPTRRSSDLCWWQNHNRFLQLDGDGAVQSQCSEQQAAEECAPIVNRSEEHTSELQSRRDLVCRLLLDKKNQLSDKRIRSVDQRMAEVSYR